MPGSSHEILKIVDILASVLSHKFSGLCSSITSPQTSLTLTLICPLLQATAIQLLHQNSGSMPLSLRTAGVDA